jgi:hypothetical protein
MESTMDTNYKKISEYSSSSGVCRKEKPSISFIAIHAQSSWPAYNFLKKISEKENVNLRLEI